MHDPSTVAFDIRRPWPVYRAKPVFGSRWYWPTLITIWHEDPETDGSDDSCGWSRPKLTKAQRSNMRFLAGCEAREPWLLRDRAKLPLNEASAEAKLRGAILAVASSLRQTVSLEEATEWAARLLHNPTDNVRGALCHLPGWHTNFPNEDTEAHREDCAASLYSILAGYILRERRPWYRHPKWHLWHWRIQVHPLQAFKRWAFSRCAGCGKRFPYGDTPCSGSWHGTGPTWFSGESNIFHSDCYPASKPVESSAGPSRHVSA